jgi:hypothetical protein
MPSSLQEQKSRLLQLSSCTSSHSTVERCLWPSYGQSTLRISSFRGMWDNTLDSVGA